ncbi:MAG: IS605 OrfB-like transposable element containing RNAse H-like and Zn finger domain [Candidatus Methanohalarchaeum thermophilum]|uniref:IS605 OrfB-like transposable element containing RNAse H-like and Zn finger domain n=1 Tax=Methanohalarchaeum thermophilum TaxID=1903181 RepID=A0A1Q6DU20_METT1|nr:MAG: IS605 OrfB-like transposable element containing RNAse H-like and Zn finger domain [Candidatus Methanohalarchaeum thermophilum]
MFWVTSRGLGNEETGRGKRMNRISNTMPYYKLIKMITYKAKEKGNKSNQDK